MHLVREIQANDSGRRKKENFIKVSKMIDACKISVKFEYYEERESFLP